MRNDDVNIILKEDADMENTRNITHRENRF